MRGDYEELYEDIVELVTKVCIFLLGVVVCVAVVTFLSPDL